MQTEFNTLHNSVFKLAYRSSHSSTNIDILNNCRTTAVVAQLMDCTLLVSSKLVEIDKSKAHTEAFTKITKIPVFNEFDRFKEYEGEELEYYTLYIVSIDNPELLFDKNSSQIYGFILKQYTKPIKILSYMRPCKIIDVNFKELIDNLDAKTMTL